MAFTECINLKLNCKILKAFVTTVTSSKTIQQLIITINNVQVQHIQKIKIPFREPTR